ncbi:MAG TPA: hypothetical protein VK509_22775, partial [Polyangiales bacterium]|nr:hypothetical protein [Polyangiales bacterium]
MSARTAALAFGSIAVWIVAAGSSAWLGIWLAIGGAAIALGSTVVLVERPAPAILLQPSIRLILVGVTAGCAMAAATYLLYPPL